jgi:hypothetical protein
LTKELFRVNDRIELYGIKRDYRSQETNQQRNLMEGKMIRRLKNNMTVLCLGTYVLFFCGGPQGPVLCIGSDGHMGLKAIMLGTCSETSPGTKRAAKVSEDLFQSIDRTCGPCVDFPLFTHNKGIPTTRTVGNGVQGQEQHPVIAHVLLTSITGPSRASLATGLPFSIGLPQPDLPAIGTIVLLI